MALNRLHGTCWANLVSWAMPVGEMTIRGTFDVKQCRPGDTDFDANGACYCGKSRTTDFQAMLDAANAPDQETEGA